MLVTKKIPGGKLIQIDFKVAYGAIQKIAITGDFFLHPEEVLDEIEKTLIGRQIENVADTIDYVLKKNDASFIGVSSQDIQELLDEEHEA